MGGGGTRVGFQGFFKLVRGGFELLAVDQVPAALEVGVPFLVLMIVVPRETTAHSGRHHYENGAGKNRPHASQGRKNKGFRAKGQSFRCGRSPPPVVDWRQFIQKVEDAGLVSSPPVEWREQAGDSYSKLRRSRGL
jgi:hypothetical protein